MDLKLCLKTSYTGKKCVSVSLEFIKHFISSIIRAWCAVTKSQVVQLLKTMNGREMGDDYVMEQIRLPWKLSEQ